MNEVDQQAELLEKLERLKAVEQEVRSLTSVVAQKDIIINKLEKELALIKDQMRNERFTFIDKETFWENSEKTYVRELSGIKSEYTKSQLSFTELTTELKKQIEVSNQIKDSLSAEKKIAYSYKMSIVNLEKEREYACTQNLHLIATVTKLRKRFKWLLYLLWPNEPKD
jgi:chromosome segregation ATPase